MTNWTVDQPAVEYVRELVAKYFPAIGLFHDSYMTVHPRDYGDHTFRNHSLKGVGGYKNRMTASGHPSRHAEGRAADIHADVRNAYLKRFGDEVFNRLAANASSLGLEDLIWNHDIWSAVHPRVHHYGSNDHEGHLHVGFSRPASQHRNPLLDRLIKEAATVTDEAFPD